MKEQTTDMDFVDTFTGADLRYRFTNEDTEKYMGRYVKPVADSSYYDVMADSEYLKKQKTAFPVDTDDAYIEYKSLIGLTSLALLWCDRCIFHAVAFLWKGFAWLLTGPSGTGKTTQYKNWKKMYLNEVEMICGDMPLLSLKKDGKIWVSPSPWNGKERLKGKVGAPLGGIVLLEHSKHNKISRMSAEECCVPLFLQFAVRPETKEQVHWLTRIASELLKRYPVWKLENVGDKESALLTQRIFEEYLSVRDMYNGEKHCMDPDLVRKGMERNGADVIDEKNADKEIVLDRICGIPVLIALASQRGRVPYISQINEVAAYCWEFLNNGVGEKEICWNIMEMYDGAEADDVRADIHELIIKLKENGYLQEKTYSKTL